MEEKSKRWDEIELICGFRIRDNQSMIKVKERYNEYSQLSQSKDSTISSKYTDEYISKLHFANSGSFSSSSSGHSQSEVGELKSRTENKSERYKETSRTTSSKEISVSQSLPPSGLSSNSLIRPVALAHEEKFHPSRYNSNSSNANIPRTTSQDSFLTTSSKQGPTGAQGTDVNNNNTNDVPDHPPRPALKKRFNSVMEDDTESVKSLPTDSIMEKKKKKKPFKKIFKSSS